MWGPKSVTAINETQVADSPGAAPVPAPACSVRQYKVTAASAWKRRFKIVEQPSQNVRYTLTFTDSFQGWGMLLSTGEPKNPAAVIAAAAKISLWRTITQLVLGDPWSESDRTQRVELKLDSMWKHNKYSVSLTLPPTDDSESENQVLEMQWKGTNDVKGFMKKLDRGMHHKLVEKSSNTLLARYVHNPWSMDVAGTVEIYADVPRIAPQQWDLFVLVSALAAAEKTLKTVKMAVSQTDIETDGMVEALAYGMTTAGQAQSTSHGGQQ
ncbi:hypothetical protein B0O99DRAFT_630681 [Bisporella sp. PMI_857]|nr:hypothetical protein B0O99DRAFT_630681 [Bisporella sp. PMI_857]